MNEFRNLLDLNVRNILNLLPREFTSALFIDKINELLPNDYASILSGRSHRVFNSWVARWYLCGLADQGLIIRVNNRQLIITRNGNKSQNQLWRKLE